MPSRMKDVINDNIKTSENKEVRVSSKSLMFDKLYEKALKLATHNENDELEKLVN